MRLDLANMLRQVLAELKRTGDDETGPYLAAVEQLREHVLQVRNGAATLEEFADCYMLNPPAGK